ncbi:peroxin 3 [Lichtheimia corymbifera JMRC:FSU:9682]|uniref:Peroxin 3 n=1 Tax=Lichtheimia corymbifera JMRC:FSU:9682 TaxID=1263082 RepID=A0A068S5H3_9FUNG|nr:peroxin 3 [Lichtheimia corymbifera JMRC:FSU:9682]
MPFLQSLKDYAKRHRKGLMVTAAIGGGSYLLGRYATEKLRDFQEKTMTERVAKENLKRRFQQNQNDCVFTVLSLLPTLGDQILNEMNIEAVWTKLQEARKAERLEQKRLREQAAAAEAEAAKAAAASTTTTTEEEDVKEEENEKKEEESSTATKEQDQHVNESKEKGEDASTQKPLDESVGSLGASVGSLGTPTQQPEGSASPVTPGLLDKDEKYKLWEEIKMKSFTRSFTSIYSLTLLTLLTHLQLNLLGRFTYVWSVSVLNRSEPTIRLQHADEEPEGGFLDPQTERMFLSASWWLLHRGWRLCAKRVEEAVEDVVSGLSLKRILTHEDAENIISKLRRRVEYERDGISPMSCRSWMLPETDEEIQEFLMQAGFTEKYPENEATLQLKKLLDETKDYIDSPDFTAVLGSCLDEVFAIFDHHAFAKALLPGAGPMDLSGQRIQEINDNEVVEVAKKVTLANLLPAIGRQAHLAISGNEYLNAFAYIKELQAFSAMIYTQYGEEITQA